MVEAVVEVRLVGVRGLVLPSDPRWEGSPSPSVGSGGVVDGGGRVELDEEGVNGVRLSSEAEL